MWADRNQNREYASSILTAEYTLMKISWVKAGIHCKGHTICDYRHKANKSASSEQLGSHDRERDQ